MRCYRERLGTPHNQGCLLAGALVGGFIGSFLGLGTVTWVGCGGNGFRP